VAASIAGVLRGTGGGDFAVGNVFGSNIANLVLVGGLVALIRPLRVSAGVLRREIPVMLLSALLLLPMLLDEHFSRPEAILLLAVFLGLLASLIYSCGKGTAHRQETLIEVTDELGKVEKLAAKPVWMNVLFIAIGLAGLALGAKMAVSGAVDIGKRAGLSASVIGLTIIALGTSLPELVTCVVAAIKGQHDISVGNLVGSNIFNTLLVTGAAGAVRPFDIEPRLAGGVDYWIMVVVGAGFAGTAIAGKRTIGRIGGTMLLCTYVAYVTYLLSR